MNAVAHRWAAGSAIFLVMADQENREQQNTGWPVAGGVMGAFLTGLPDKLEPALHPNHRQFFHSIVFAAALGMCWIKLREWQPETEFDGLLRKVGMIGIGAYLVHLAVDATTAKSLPLIGKL